MKDSLEQVIIAFTTESQLLSLANIFLGINDDDKQILFLKKYIDEKTENCKKLLHFTQDIKDQIGEYNINDWFVEVNGNIGLEEDKENIQNLLKIEKNNAEIMYPECAKTTASEGLIDISVEIRKFADQSKKNIDEMGKLI